MLSIQLPGPPSNHYYGLNMDIPPLSNVSAQSLRKPSFTGPFGRPTTGSNMDTRAISFSPHPNGKPNPSTPGAKRRPSRAGTRSVATLTAAQLERKRANDREAQRAIRQRTKDQIETLQRRIEELTSGDDNNAKLMQALRRNEELEKENLMLRRRLDQAVVALQDHGGIPTDGVITPGGHTPTDRVTPNLHARTSPAASLRSIHSATTTGIPTPLTTQPETWSTHQTSAYQPQTPSSMADSPSISSLTAAPHAVGHTQPHQPAPNAHPHPSWSMVPVAVCAPDDRPLETVPTAGYPYVMDPSTAPMHFSAPAPEQQTMPYHSNPNAPNMGPGPDYQPRGPPMSGPIPGTGMHGAPGPYGSYQGYLSPTAHPAEAAQGLSMMGRSGGMDNGHMMYNGMATEVKTE